MGTSSLESSIAGFEDQRIVPEGATAQSVQRVLEVTQNILSEACSAKHVADPVGEGSGGVTFIIADTIEALVTAGDIIDIVLNPAVIGAWIILRV